MGMEAKIVKTITVQCDGPECPVHLEFIENDPSTYCDAMWRFVTLVRFDGTNHLFCSKFCLLNFMQDYQPLERPKPAPVPEQPEQVAA